MQSTGQDVIRIIRLLEESGVPAWLDGGWGIDALLKTETRAHRDVDLVIPLEYLITAELVLEGAGFSKDCCGTDLPTRLVLRSREGLEIDIHPVTFKPDGSAVHIDTEGGGGLKYIYVYSPAGFSGVGEIDGCVVRCTTAAEQIRQKVERVYSPWSEARIRERGFSVDLVDIVSLLKVFGSDESRLAPVGTAPDATTTGNQVADAAKQFCLRHLGSLNAEHSHLSTRHAELSAKHDELRAQYAELSAKYDELRAQYAELDAQHSQLGAQQGELMAQIDAMRASTSWHLTAPMRWTVKRLGLRWLRLRTQYRA